MRENQVFGLNEKGCFGNSSENGNLVFKEELLNGRENAVYRA